MFSGGESGWAFKKIEPLDQVLEEEVLEIRL
jgi:hypothetical protein